MALTPDLAALARHSKTEAQLGDGEAARSFHVSLREDGAQALGSEGLVCSCSSATNLHALPSLSLC